jgi:hypothetical protein
MCGGCKTIVPDADKCSSCDNFNCANCSRNLNQGKLLPLRISKADEAGSCMHCRMTPYKPVKISRQEKAALDAIEFRCPLCSDTVTYKNAKYHTLFGC